MSEIDIYRVVKSSVKISKEKWFILEVIGEYRWGRRYYLWIRINMVGLKYNINLK